MGYEYLWRIHAGLMASSFLAMVTGIVVSLFYKKRNWRFKTHKRLGIYAGTSGIAALLIAGIMVQIYNGVHFTSLHAVLGGISGVLLIATPQFGLAIKRSKKKKTVKNLHKTLGYGTALMMGVTIFSGLLFMGIVSI